jgi:hypothetical protein
MRQDPIRASAKPKQMFFLFWWEGGGERKKKYKAKQTFRAMKYATKFQTHLTT